MAENLAEKFQNDKLSLQQGIKSKIFDFVAISILLILIAISLGVIERRAITLQTLGNILVECIPLFFASILLNKNYYMKGVFTAKSTTKFINASTAYSQQIAKLNGKQIDKLDDFCQYFNDDALIKMQKVYLKRAAVSFELFDTELKIKSNYELSKIYNEERMKWIRKAKNCKIKGLRVNTLLGTNDSDDITDIGPTESQLSNKHGITSAFSFLLSVVLMSLIGVKNVMEWGWFGTLLVLFKCIYIFCKSYMSYFDGYNDVTIKIVNHTNRKTDILKQFFPWYETNYVDVKNIDCQLEIDLTNGNKK